MRYDIIQSIIAVIIFIFEIDNTTSIFIQKTNKLTVSIIKKPYFIVKKIFFPYNNYLNIHPNLFIMHIFHYFT